MHKEYAFAILLTIAILSYYSCSQIYYSKASCDTIYFFEDNTKNDTGKLTFEGRVVFDTSANRIAGSIVDSNSNTAIAGAKVYITNGNINYQDSTDNNGNFSFFKNDFNGIWQMSIYDYHHICLQIKNIDVHGGLTIKIKLHK